LVQKLCLFLFVISCLVYANTMLNGYAYDDPLMIQKNVFVQQGIKAIPMLLATPHLRGFYVITNDLYRPLSLVMFAIEYQLWGPNPAAGHFFNILCYGLCVVFLFLFLDKLFGSSRTITAFIAALLFAIHPIHTEVVANIKSRDELLCFLFAFLSLYVFMNYMKEGKAWQLAAGSFALLLAYLSKETVISFIVIIPFIFFFYYAPHKRRAVFITAGMLVATGIFLFARHYVLSKYNADLPTPVILINNSLIGAPGMVSKIATEFVILGKYLKLMVIPFPLLSDYAYNSIPYAGLGSIGFWLSFCAYCCIGFTGLYRWIRKKNDLWAFGIIFYLTTIFLFSNIPFLISGELAERFVFFASVGFCLVAALAIEQWIIKGAAQDIRVFKNKKLLAVLIPVIFIFSSLTVARNMDWESSYTLFRHDVAKSPNDSRLHHHFSVAIDVLTPLETDSVKRHELEDESLWHLRKALEIYPEYEDALTAISHAYSSRQRYDSAALSLQKALAINPKNTTAINDLGYVYFNSGRYTQALTYFKELAGIEVSPAVLFAYYNQARTFTKLKAYDSVILYSNKTLAIDSVFADAHFEMAEAFLQEQNFDSAEYHYKRYALLLPASANATNGLGLFYFNRKRYDEAITQFKKASEIDPKFINAYANMGIAYFLTNRYEAAIAVFNKELALDPHNGQDIPYMAIAYERMGNMELAQKYEAIVQRFDPGFKLPPLSAASPVK